MLLIFLVCIWLTVCAVQDYDRRQVSNWLTYPALAAAFVYRLSLFSPLFFVLLVFVSGLLYLLWEKGWVGGADFKAALALLLLNPNLLFWANCGVITSYFWWKVMVKKEVTRTMPAFGGFMVGSYCYLLAKVLYG